MIWPFQDANNKLSAVTATSLTNGPQIIRRRGKNTAVIMSFADYERLTAPHENLKKTLMSTGFDVLELARDKSTNDNR